MISIANFDSGLVFDQERVQQRVTKATTEKVQKQLPSDAQKCCQLNSYLWKEGLFL